MRSQLSYYCSHKADRVLFRKSHLNKTKNGKKIGNRREKSTAGKLSFCRIIFRVAYTGAGGVENRCTGFLGENQIPSTLIGSFKVRFI